MSTMSPKTGVKYLNLHISISAIKDFLKHNLLKILIEYQINNIRIINKVKLCVLLALFQIYSLNTFLFLPLI